jgi:hypothetical protein
MRSPCCPRVCVCVCPCPFQPLNQLTYFHEAFHERYAIGGQLNLVLFNVLKSVTIIWRTRETVRFYRHERHIIQGPEMVYGNR